MRGRALFMQGRHSGGPDRYCMRLSRILVQGGQLSEASLGRLVSDRCAPVPEHPALRRGDAQGSQRRYFRRDVGGHTCYWPGGTASPATRIRGHRRVNPGHRPVSAAAHARHRHPAAPARPGPPVALVGLAPTPPAPRPPGPPELKRLCRDNTMITANCNRLIGSGW